MLYLDASALVKLVVPESETGRLLELLSGQPGVTSSIVAHVEVRRAVQRAGSDPRLTARADAVLRELDAIPLTVAIAEHGGRLPGAGLRALDAIHLASAMALEQISAFVVYDRRLANAAAEHGLNVVSPE